MDAFIMGLGKVEVEDDYQDTMSRLDMHAIRAKDVMQDYVVPVYNCTEADIQRVRFLSWNCAFCRRSPRSSSFTIDWCVNKMDTWRIRRSGWLTWRARWCANAGESVCEWLSWSNFQSITGIPHSRSTATSNVSPRLNGRFSWSDMLSTCSSSNSNRQRSTPAAVSTRRHKICYEEQEHFMKKMLIRNHNVSLFPCRSSSMNTVAGSWKLRVIARQFKYQI